MRGKVTYTKAVGRWRFTGFGLIGLSSTWPWISRYVPLWIPTTHHPPREAGPRTREVVPSRGCLDRGGPYGSP